MPSIISTDTFAYNPPAPSINSLSSLTGSIGDTITIYGNNLDYIDNLIIDNENIPFQVNTIDQISFQIPNNLSSGIISIKSGGIIIPQNQLQFTPIFEIDSFSPIKSELSGLITVKGKVLNSITTGYLLANPITEDIEYDFLRSQQEINLTTSQNTGKSELIFVQNFNLQAENSKHSIIKYADPDIISGRVLGLKFKKEPLQQKYYEQHIFNFPIIDSPNIKSSTGIIYSGNLDKEINFSSNFSNSGYGIFYSFNYTGTGLSVDSGYNTVFGYSELKSISGFTLSICDRFYEDIPFYYMAVKYGTGIYDSGNYYCSGVNISSGIVNQQINYPNTNLYAPFILTSLEAPTNKSQSFEQRRTTIGSTYIDANIFNLQKNNFSVNLPSGLSLPNGTGLVNLNYITFDNPNANLNTFILNGNESYYKKIFLFTGDENSFQERVKVEDLQIIDKNTLTFRVPNTSYHINGSLILNNYIGVEKYTQQIFIETPLATGINSGNLEEGDDIILYGLSFKKPILIDGTGYNGVTVRFKYLENLYKQKDNNFSINCLLLDVNTLSGILPNSNLSTGRYMVQILDEEGNIYE